MFNFLLRFFVFLTIYHSGNLYATYEVDEQDLKASKKEFLISGYPSIKNRSNISNYSSSYKPISLDIEEKDEKAEKLLILKDEKSQQTNKGVMTLCFKKQNGTYDDVSLVFEMFFPKTSDELSLRMVRYGKEEGCCGGGKEEIIVEGHTDTLKKSYRAVKISNVSGDREYVPATHTRYASWIVSNNDLLKGLLKAEDDQKNQYSPGNGVKYVKRIMETVGLEKVDFGYWTTKPDNLKLLVDSYIEPKYDYKY